jgi:tetrathionate reductase subunit B
MDRREFVRHLLISIPAAGGVLSGLGWRAGAEEAPDILKTYDPGKHLYGMGIQVANCIGCGRCMVACKTENNVPKEPFYYRTWVERYIIQVNNNVTVANIDDPLSRASDRVNEKEILRTFFVPKLCNQCKEPPCVQVCPVGATFSTLDGVVLIDEKRCIGCRYCIQACPYGMRYIHPATQTADKCTFCYHRIVRGLLPACVEVCPTETRVFGDLVSRASPLARFTRMNNIHVLKPSLNTEPKVLYADLDGEVR